MTDFQPNFYFSQKTSIWNMDGQSDTNNKDKVTKLVLG